MISKIFSHQNQQEPLEAKKTIVSQAISAFTQGCPWNYVKKVGLGSLRKIGGLLNVSSQEKLSSVPAPKIIHRIWVGKNIPKDYLYNILLDARSNPEHKIVLYTDRIKSFYSTLDEMIDVEERPQFRALAKKYGERVEIKTIGNLEEELKACYPSATKLMAIAERERYPESPLHNYPAATDCYRLAALYVHGGVYRDGDVMAQSPVPSPMIPKYGLLMQKAAHFQAYNNVLVAQPKAPVIKGSMDSIVSNYEKCEETWDIKRRFDKKMDTDGRVYSPREGGTLVITGPIMIQHELSYAGRYSGELVVNLKDCYIDMGEGHPGDFSVKTKEEIAKYDPQINDVLFANYREGVDASGKWRNAPPIARRAVESPF